MEIVNYIYKAWAKKISIILAILTLILATIAILPAVNAVNNNNQCGFNRDTANAQLSVGSGSITATFRVPNNCKNERVSFVVYTIADGNYQNKIGNQHIFASRTVVSNGGNHRITLPLPNCAWQADVVKGNPVRVGTGADQGVILRATHGNDGQPCRVAPPKQPPQTPPSDNPPPSQDKNVNKNVNKTTVVTNVNQSQKQKQTVIVKNNFSRGSGHSKNKSVAAATSATYGSSITTGGGGSTTYVSDAAVSQGVDYLPNSGPGDLAAIFTIVSAAGSTAFYVVSRRYGLEI